MPCHAYFAHPRGAAVTLDVAATVARFLQLPQRRARTRRDRDPFVPDANRVRPQPKLEIKRHLMRHGMCTLDGKPTCDAGRGPPGTVRDLPGPDRARRIHIAPRHRRCADRRIAARPERAARGESELSASQAPTRGRIEQVGVVRRRPAAAQRRLDDPSARAAGDPFIAHVPARSAGDSTLTFDTAQLPNGPTPSRPRSPTPPATRLAPIPWP